MPRFMLDTDISSYILRDRPAVVGNRLRRVRGADVCVSVITEAELQYGVRLAGGDNDLRRDVDDFLRRLEVLLWDSAAAAEYAEIRSDLEGRGTPIGNMVLMIAAHARALGATLVTSDKAIANLRLVRDEDVAALQGQHAPGAALEVRLGPVLSGGPHSHFNGLDWCPTPRCHRHLQQERGMKAAISAILCLALAACGRGEEQLALPREPGPDAIGHICGMTLKEHQGPKGQVLPKGAQEPLWFSTVRDALTYVEQDIVSEREIAGFWVNDMALGTWEHPASGSWIDANFYIWIGHPDDHRAWGQLADAREALESPADGVSATARAQAREEMFIAEGSDWFWWYGDDHSSDHDMEFDDLFRRHLRNVYRLLQKPVPDELYTSNISSGAPPPLDLQPTALVSPTIDGEETSYFEWLGAGVLEVRETAGAMHQIDAPKALTRIVLFGFDRRAFSVRVDLTRRAQALLDEGYDIALKFIQPEGLAVSARSAIGMASVPRATKPRRASVQTAEHAQWTTRKGRTTLVCSRSRGGSTPAITASVLSLAPRLASTSARAAAPRRARRTGSPIRLRIVVVSSRAERTCTAASLARNASAISAKFCMCGPTTMGLPNAAGSRML